MNQKTAKILRKYAREKTNSPEDAKLAYRKLKAEYREWVREHGT